MTKKVKQDQGIVRGGGYTREAEIISIGDTTNSETNPVVRVSIASETPCQIGEGYRETLLLDGMRTERVGTTGVPFLLAHDRTNIIGRVLSIAVEGDQAIADIELRTGTQAYTDIVGKWQKGVSVGYRILAYERKETADYVDYVVSDWEVLEVSSVSVPCDSTVGFRSEQPELNKKLYNDEQEPENNQRDQRHMNQQERRAACKTENLSNESTIAALSENWDIEQIRSIAAVEKGTLAKLKEQEDKHKADTKERAAELESLKVEVQALKEQPKKTPLYQRKEKEPSFSLAKAFGAHARQEEQSGYEDEAIKECCPADKRVRQANPNSLVLPGLAVAQAAQPYAASVRERALVASAGGSGLIEREHRGQEFINMLRAGTPLERMGVRMLNLTKDVSIPKQTGGGLFQAISSDLTTGNLTQSAPTFGNIELTMHTAGAKLDVSRKVLAQSDPSVSAILASMFLDDASEYSARQLFEGDGSGNNVRGIKNISGINSTTVGRSGSGTPTAFQPTRAQLIDMRNAVYQSGVTYSNGVFVASTEVMGWLENLPTQVGSGFYVGEFQSPETFSAAKFPVVRWDGWSGTGNTKGNNLFFGEFRHAWMAIFDQLEFLFDNNNDFGGQTLRCFLDYDFNLAHTTAISEAA